MTSDGPTLSFLDVRGTEVLTLAATDASVGFALADRSGKDRVKAAINGNIPNIVLNNSAGGPGVGMTVDQQLGSIITIHDLNGAVRARMSTNGEETTLGLADSNQTDRVGLHLKADTASLYLIDRSNKTRAVLTQSNEGTVLGFSDPQGKLRAALGEREGGARLDIANQNGKVIASLPK